MPVATPSEVRSSVEARVASRTGDRLAKIGILQEPGGIAVADEPRRVAVRIDRLGRHYPDLPAVSTDAVAAAEPGAMATAKAILEAIVLDNDLLGVGYLEGGVRAAHAVGRINVRDDRGKLLGYGTGSLVTPELLLTNHHVLSDGDVAENSMVEFNYQDGMDGRPKPVVGFDLDPERFFMANEELDFALTAVKAPAGELDQFGFNELVGEEGKAIVGDYVTIVQHPRGDKKMVALRENRVVDVLDKFLHYETDTEPGSSGSPVFNDQWEIVALHHASVPAPGHGELGGRLNEGLRISTLLAFLRDQDVPAEQKALLAKLI